MAGQLLDGYVEGAIYKLLSSNPGVLGFVTADRISPVMLPELVKYPAISFFRVDTPCEVDLEGSARLEHPRIQVDAWANTAREAHLTARAVKLALEGFSGKVSGLDVVFNPWNCDINAIIADDERGPVWEKETKTYHASIDVIVWYND